MSTLLTEIEIENFRSIRKASIQLDFLSVLVGTNDSGKSNVLRALNLFFNGETGKGRPLHFDFDHCVHNRPNRRAKEIVIRIKIQLPDAYVANNGDFINWEKRWREDGLHSDEYKGYRVTTNRRGREVQSEVRISPRSNVHSLLRKIEFVYVPAVRDATYFDFLRGQIHSVISDAADESFRTSSEDFERAISQQLASLTEDIRGELDIASRLALPHDLSHVFERLDFLTGAREISLDARGDGIKARHIPLILKFMADQKRSLQTRGAAPISIIWGYEEPENNLEFRHAIALADELWSFMQNDIAQVIITSHSPVFYNLVEKNTPGESYVSCLHVHKSDEEQGTQISEDLSTLDERMGTTAILAPRILAMEQQIRSEQVAKAAAARLAEAGRGKIFVEGTSDRSFVTKIFHQFAPGFLGDLADIETLPSGAGHSYVGDMLRAWYCIRKHHGGVPRAVGILDSDDPGNLLRRDWNAVGSQARVCKCFNWPIPNHIRLARQAGINLPVSLEELYPLDVWRWANDEGYLEPRAISDFLNPQLRNRIIRGEESLDARIRPEFDLYSRNSFLQAGKGPAVARVIRQHDDLFRQNFEALQTLVRDIVAYIDPPN